MKYNGNIFDKLRYGKSYWYKSGKTHRNYWGGITSVYTQQQKIKYDRINKWFIKK